MAPASGMSLPSVLGDPSVLLPLPQGSLPSPLWGCFSGPGATRADSTWRVGGQGSGAGGEEWSQVTMATKKPGALCPCPTRQPMGRLLPWPLFPSPFVFSLLPEQMASCPVPLPSFLSAQDAPPFHAPPPPPTQHFIPFCCPDHFPSGPRFESPLLCLPAGQPGLGAAPSLTPVFVPNETLLIPIKTLAQSPLGARRSGLWESGVRHRAG